MTIIENGPSNFESDILLKDLAENIPAAIFQYTRYSEDRQYITYINSACEMIWEITADYLKGNPAALWEVVHPEDLDDMKRSVEVSAENLTNWNHEWRITTPTRKTKWLRGSGVPRATADGGVLWNSIIFDITSEKEFQDAISQALHKTIHVLAAALEKRDPYTAGHEENVAKICVLIARKLGFDEKRVAGLELAARVHDVGKIAIPSEILSKPSKLLDAEYALIKEHPAIGAELLEEVEFEWPISTMILQHHERLDGSGYPSGLKGDEILLEARIIAVADTIDAMASHRPYRAALGIEPAAKEIRNGAGSKYDTDVVNACLELIDEGQIQF